MCERGSFRSTGPGAHDERSLCIAIHQRGLQLRSGGGAFRALAEVVVVPPRVTLRFGENA